MRCGLRSGEIIYMYFCNIKWISVNTRKRGQRKFHRCLEVRVFRCIREIREGFVEDLTFIWI